MALRALLVDDNPTFIEAASGLLEGDGITVVGAATTGAQAIRRARQLQPDVVLIDIQLGQESGFDLALRLAAATAMAPTSMILMSTYAAADFADRVAVSPALGFLSKSGLSGVAIRDLLDDRTHGHGCRHEALVHSTADEFVAGAEPFMRRGLAADDVVLVVMRETGQALLREALDEDASRIEFADAADWYRTTRHAFERYRRYVHDHIDRGAGRVRVVAEALVPGAPADWTRYEAAVSVAMAAEPVSFICVYDTCELPAGIVADASRTHPLLRSRDGARPSPRYEDPRVFASEFG